ncbi:MAG: OmpW family outer membrane protein [Thermodesulfobacteriota bacterium]|nr:OmpW family outer membrane protein [Thermodesulfobacteriota bacterium]
MMKGLKKAGGLMAILVAVSLILVGVSAPTYAMEGDSPWLVRLRVLSVVPDEDNTGLMAGGDDLGGDVEVDDAFTAELDISYFFTENIAAEMIFGVANHDVEVDLGGADIDLGDVWLLPPTLTLQYHFMPAAQFRPYVGAGINYTIFFGEDEGDADEIEYDDGFGYALQAGFDWGLNEKWGLNVDVKKIWLETDVEVDNAVTTEVDLDPWFIGVGVSYKF